LVRKSHGYLYVYYSDYNGSFSQPGVINPSKPALGGGSSTPMFSNGSSGAPAMSSVAYDSAIQRYVMTYLADWKNNVELVPKLGLVRIAERD
jgi:hypothetical protein